MASLFSPKARPRSVYQSFLELRTLFNKIHKSVQIMELPVDIEVIASQRRKKTLSLEVYPTKVIVRVPATLSKSEIQDFLDQRRQWLLDKWQEMQSRKPTASVLHQPPTVASDEDDQTTTRHILLYGKSHPIIRVTHAELGRRETIIQVRNDVVEIVGPVASANPVDGFPTRELMVTWLRTQARRDFILRLNQWATTMNVSFAKFRLKDQKTRWGSCSSMGNINLNWRLIQAPKWVIDYVVIHELAHLTELNHSRAFWAIVATYCPRYQDAKAWLKQYGHELLRW